ncbi:MAG: beta-lactamase family protein, partial [Anaerolineales bacterium]|nr:beta-lactamase family protein [Anaerolineales bacterium]
YGLADREREIPNTAETVFSLGSVTKQFTAAAVMKLVQQGQLAPTDTIGQYIQGVPADKAAITLHHLLTHTAGIVNYTGDDYESAQAEEILETILTTPLDFEPGSQYNYSNAGYSLLALMVESVAKQPFEQFLYEQLLQPAGLEHTGYTRPDWQDLTVARWYTGDIDNGHALEKQYPSWHIMGNGEMLSTLDDLHRWHQILLTDALLHAPSKDQMFTPFLRDYGYGWRIVETELGQLIEHNGASDLGSSALFRRYVDADLTIILFCNQSFGDTPLVLPLQDKLEQLLAGEEINLPPAVPVPAPDALLPFVGEYGLPSGGRLHVRPTQTHLLLTAEGQDALNMLAFPEQPAEAYFELNDRTQEAIAQALEGDYEPLRVFMANHERRFAPVTNMLNQRISEAEHHLGVRQEVSAVGTVPSSFVAGALDTIIAVRFERGVAGVVSISDGAQNVGLTVLEIAQGWSLPCLPTAADELIGYHIPLAQTVHLRLHEDHQGRQTLSLSRYEGVTATKL